MIDPVSVIMTAWLTNAANDAYAALKKTIASRYGPQVTGSLDALQRDPSPQRRSAVAQELRRSGAAADPEVVDLADRLMQLMSEPEVVLAAPAAADPVEGVRRAAGLDAMSRLLESHVRRVADVRTQYMIDDRNLLSTRVGTRAGLPGEISAQLTGLHEQIRRIIAHIATTIEESRYREVDSALASLQLGMAEKHRAVELVRADKQMHVAYETLRLTIEYFSEANERVLARLQHEQSRRHEANLLFGNAILVLELADFMIRFIEGFELTDDVEGLHQDALARLVELRTRAAALEKQVRERGGDGLLAERTLANIAHREAAYQELEREWEAYMREIRRLKEAVGNVKGEVTSFEILREDAELQLMTLQQVAMLSVLKQNTESVRGAMASLQSFRLAPLSAHRVRRLLGV